MADAIPVELAEFLSWFRCGWDVSGEGLREDELDDIERREGVRLPPELRLMLGSLPPGRQGRSNVCVADWRVPGIVTTSDEELLDGLVFDLESGWLWNPEWGDHEIQRKPHGLAELTALFRAAPRLLPATGGLVLADPSHCGPVVLGVRQSDAIVGARDLRASILRTLNIIDHAEATRGVRWDEIERLPLWGPIISSDDRWHRDPCGW